MTTIGKSLRYLRWEIIITGTVIAMPIMVPFYNSIGMNQGQIGLSQAFFTAALMLVNIPTGWIADRFSRKFCNAIGDLGCAISLLLYSQATGFTGVVFAEIALGIALAFSQGADGALLKAYAQLLDPYGRNNLFRKQFAILEIWKPIAQAVALIIGGLIGSSNLRLAIAVSAAPYLIGCILSLLIKEEGARHISEHRNPFRDMFHVACKSVGTNPNLRWHIIGFGVGREITHVMIWALTPLLLLAGVPLKIVAVGWVINSLSVVMGAWVASRWSVLFNSWQKFLIPMATVIATLIVMSIDLSIKTIWLYSFLGLAQGWIAATMMPMVQELAPDSNQAIIISITRSASQLLYIPLVWMVGLAGNVDIRLTMVATVVIFAPMVIVTAVKLYNLEIK